MILFFNFVLGRTKNDIICTQIKPDISSKYEPFEEYHPAEGFYNFFNCCYTPFSKVNFNYFFLSCRKYALFAQKDFKQYFELYIKNI